MENNQSIVQMPKQFKPQVTIEEEMNINRRTISEIEKVMWDSDNEVRKKYTFNNNIVLNIALRTIDLLLQNLTIKLKIY